MARSRYATWPSFEARTLLDSREHCLARHPAPLSLRHAAAVGVLLIGALLYLTRPTDPVVIEWLSRVAPRLASMLHDVREIAYAHVHLPAWFRGAASDAAYAFSL